MFLLVPALAQVRAAKGSKCRNRNISDSGFTLLDVLVSLVLVALLASLLPGTLQLGQRVLGAGEPLLATAAHSPARAFLEQRLAEAQPVFRRNADGQRVLDFAGTPLALSFVAPAVVSARAPGLVRYSIGTAAKGGVARVAMQLTGDDDGTAGDSAADDVVLDSAAALTFRYFGRRTADSKPAWYEDWQGEAALPRLVEISFEEARRHASQNVTGSRPPLVVELRLSTPD
ncbi:MAG: hypothetical protein ABL907_19080 [Hyphomicrobium sp.]